MRGDSSEPRKKFCFADEETAPAGRSRRNASQNSVRSFSGQLSSLSRRLAAGLQRNSWQETESTIRDNRLVPRVSVGSTTWCTA